MITFPLQISDFTLNFSLKEQIFPRFLFIIRMDFFSSQCNHLIVFVPGNTLSTILLLHWDFSHFFLCGDIIQYEAFISREDNVSNRSRENLVDIFNVRNQVTLCVQIKIVNFNFSAFGDSCNFILGNEYCSSSWESLNIFSRFWNTFIWLSVISEQVELSKRFIFNISSN